MYRTGPERRSAWLSGPSTDHLAKETTTPIDLRPTERARVYRFGSVWHWKCAQPDCHSGRSRVLSEACDAARAHLYAEHAPSVAMRIQPWPSNRQYMRWYVYVVVGAATAYAVGYVQQPHGTQEYYPCVWIYTSESRHIEVAGCMASRDEAAEKMLNAKGLTSRGEDGKPLAGRRLRVIMDGRDGGEGPG